MWITRYLPCAFVQGVAQVHAFCNLPATRSCACGSRLPARAVRPARCCTMSVAVDGVVQVLLAQRACLRSLLCSRALCTTPACCVGAATICDVFIARFNVRDFWLHCSTPRWRCHPRLQRPYFFCCTARRLRWRCHARLQRHDFLVDTIVHRLGIRFLPPRFSSSLNFGMRQWFIPCMSP